MSTIEIQSKIEQLKELESFMEEIKTEVESPRDEIKSEMLNRDVDTLEAGQFIVRWTACLSQRLDTTALKRAMPEVYKAYLKQVSSRRFTISV